MDGIETYIPPVAQMLGIDPATALLLVTIIVSVANLTGRLIPDDATGFLGGVRKIAKVIGLYTGNRVTSGISVNDVASSVVGTRVVEQVEDLAGRVDALIPEVVDTVAFPGVPKRDPATGKFVSRDSET